jgi:putative resolvase
VRAKETLKLLRISRPTLYRYIKTGIIRFTVLPNTRYEYNDEDIYKFFNKNVQRKIFLYARVSTRKQKQDLSNQIEMLKSWSLNAGYRIDGIYSDIASGISFENRNGFFDMLDEILEHRVETVIVAYKDRLSRIGFDLFAHLFERFGTRIIVISGIGNEKLDSQEIFEEIVSLLHCYSMKLYSKRRKKHIEVGIA